MAESDDLQVLYIMGTARSGSTILEILLSHGQGVFGAGELTALVQDGFIDNKPCSCGALFNECVLWGRVKKELGLSSAQLCEWVELQRKIDWHYGFFRQLLRLVGKDEYKKYKKYNKSLFLAIKKISGENVIVDSSKYSGRAMALSRFSGLNVKIICLTRSPRGLMSSFKKPNKDEQRPKNNMEVLVYYLVTTFSFWLSSRLLKREVEYLSFEEMMDRPISTMSKIADFSGIDLNEACLSIEQGRSFSVGHIVTGNRLRKQGVVRFDSSLSMESMCLSSWDTIFVRVMDFWGKILGIRARYYASKVSGD